MSPVRRYVPLLLADPWAWPQARPSIADIQRIEADITLGEANVVVINGNRTTAIVIRHRGESITLVPMKSGRLSAKTVGFDEFREEWTETGYALSQGLTTFLAHIMKWGASIEVVKGLDKLAARDRFVVASLF